MQIITRQTTLTPATHTSRLLPYLAIVVFILGGCPFALMSEISLAYAEVDIINNEGQTGKIVFTKISKNQEKDIFIADLKTGSTQSLFSSNALDEYPTWSPDGKRVVFYSDFCDDREIFSIRSDGRDLKRLTNHKGIDEDPDWSPDGKKIVFRSEQKLKGSSNIYSMRVDGRGLKKLTSLPKENAVPRWSPNGREIIFSSNSDWPGWDLLILDLKTGVSPQLTKGSRSYARAAWHPSGGSFAFSYGTTEKVSIWTFKKGESKPKQITKRLGKNFDPVFSDDGSKLFFTGELQPGTDQYFLFVKNLKSGTTTQLSEGSSSIRHISWSSLPEFKFKHSRKKAKRKVKPRAENILSTLKPKLCGKKSKTISSVRKPSKVNRRDSFPTLREE